MKKTGFFAALLFCGLLAKGQDNTGMMTNDFKPTAKSITAEVNFVPWGGAPVALPNLRGRYFISDNVAIRGGLDIRYQHNSPSKDVTQDMFQLNIIPGIEKHFAGTNRLSPYIGADLVFGFASSSSQVTAGGTTYDVKGAWTDTAGLTYSNRGNMHFGVNAVAGTDFYFARHFYTGIEMGYGFMVTSFSDVTVKGTVVDKGGSNFTLGSNVVGALRLGFVF